MINRWIRFGEDTVERLLTEEQVEELIEFAEELVAEFSKKYKCQYIY